MASPPGPAEADAGPGREAAAGGAERPPAAPGGELSPANSGAPASAAHGSGPEEHAGADPRPGAFEPGGLTRTGQPSNGNGKGSPGSEDGLPPLHLQLRVVAGRTIAGVAAPASVRIAASAPCHLAAYQVDSTGHVTALLPAANAARMPAATTFRLAIRPRAGVTLRVVALASRQPLSARGLHRCLLAFLTERGHPGADAGDSEAESGAALSAVSNFLARQVGAGAKAEPLPERPLWAAGVSLPIPP